MKFYVCLDMSCNYAFTAIGLLILFLRFYILEIRLPEMYSPRNRYLSRALAYFYCFALILNFRSDVLNVILLTAFFLEIYIVFDNDRRFFVSYFKGKELNNGEERNPWVLFERLTLHVPLVLTVAVWFYQEMSVFFGPNGQPLAVWIPIASLALGVCTFLAFDVRNPFGKKFEEPLGRNILSIMIGSWVIVM